MLCTGLSDTGHVPIENICDYENETLRFRIGGNLVFDKLSCCDVLKDYSMK